MRVKSAEESANRWAEGMIRTPPMPCKYCRRKTRAWWRKGRCQYCGQRLPYSEAVTLASELGLRRL